MPRWPGDHRGRNPAAQVTPVRATAAWPVIAQPWLLPVLAAGCTGFDARHHHGPDGTMSRPLSMRRTRRDPVGASNIRMPDRRNGRPLARKWRRTHLTPKAGLLLAFVNGMGRLPESDESVRKSFRSRPRMRSLHPTTPIMAAMSQQGCRGQNQVTSLPALEPRPQSSKGAGLLAATAEMKSSNQKLAADLGKLSPHCPRFGRLQTN